jgi:hypothetical protein
LLAHVAHRVSLAMSEQNRYDRVESWRFSCFALPISPSGG